jgi:hypothetical protein
MTDLRARASAAQRTRSPFAELSATTIAHRRALYGRAVNSCPSLTGLLANVREALPVLPALSVTRVVIANAVLPSGTTNEPPTTQVAVVTMRPFPR